MAHMSPNRGRLLFGVVEKAPEVAQNSHQKYFAHGPHVSKQREAAFWGGVKGARGCPEFPAKICCSWPTCLQTEGGCFLGWWKRRPRLPRIPIKNTLLMAHMSPNRGRLLFGVVEKAPEVAQKSHQKYFAHGPHVSKQREAAFWGGVKGARGCPEVPSKIFCSWPTCLQTEGGCCLGWWKRRPRLPRIPSKNILLMAHMSPNRGRLLFGVVEKAPEVAQNSHQKYVAHGPHVSKQREAAFWGGGKGARGCPEFPSKIFCSWPTCLQTEGGCFLGWWKRRPRLPRIPIKNTLLMAHMSPNRGRLLFGVV